jgi:hypothetical protein
MVFSGREAGLILSTTNTIHITAYLPTGQRQPAYRAVLIVLFGEAQGKHALSRDRPRTREMDLLLHEGGKGGSSVPPARSSGLWVGAWVLSCNRCRVAPGTAAGWCRDKPREVVVRNLEEGWCGGGL